MIRSTGRGPTLLSLIAVAALLLAACGDGSDGTGDATPDEPTDEATTPTQATEQMTSEPAAQAEAVPAPSEPVKVTYRMTGDGADQLEQITLSWDAPRYAMIFEDGKLIVSEDETVFCDAAGEGCFRMSAEGGAGPMAGALGPFFGFTSALQEGQELPGATVTGEEEIAGRTATCATYDAAQYDPSLQGEAEYCYDPDSGVLLRWSATDESGTQTLEATEVGEPDPSDFEPTGPVQDMPGGGGG